MKLWLVSHSRSSTLHDSIEDGAGDFAGGVEALRACIASDAGPPVLAIVDNCTGSETAPKPGSKHDALSRERAPVPAPSGELRRVVGVMGELTGS